MAFYFEKPEKFVSTAGQYCDFTLINPKDNDDEGTVRSFTLASAPCEDSLFIATRIRDTAFKRVLKSLDSGSSITIEGPYGELVLGDEDVPAVFLTGGIGITPVRSMVQQALFEKNPRRLVAFYSNRKPKDAPFLDELTRTAEKYPTFTLVPTMTATKSIDNPWTGESGHISADLLRRHLEDVTTPTYYLSGPPALVASLQNLLKDLGVKEANIHAEDFLGY
jgi:ferredoxin-NADP reductase